MKHVIVEGISRAKFHSSQKPGILVHGKEKGGVEAQYTTDKQGTLFVRTAERMNYPDHMGWTTAKLQSK